MRKINWLKVKTLAEELKTFRKLTKARMYKCYPGVKDGPRALEERLGKKPK